MGHSVCDLSVYVIIVWSKFWILMYSIIMKVLERQRKEKKIRINFLKTWITWTVMGRTQRI